MNRAVLASACLALASTACQQGGDENVAIDESNVAANIVTETLPPDEVAYNVEDSGTQNEASGNVSQSEATIPARYRGRWGMVAADCTSVRGDAKGLIIIADTNVRFYEATATLKEQRPATGESFSGLFGFTGEGQAWEKVMTFTRDGDMLKRAEPEGTFTYRRCG